MMEMNIPRLVETTELDRRLDQMPGSWHGPIDWFSSELAWAKAFTDEWSAAMAKLREMYPELPKRGTQSRRIVD